MIPTRLSPLFASLLISPTPAERSVVFTASSVCGLSYAGESMSLPGGNLGDNPSLQLQRARALVEKQKLQEAQEELRRILKDQPRHLDANGPLLG